MLLTKDFVIVYQIFKRSFIYFLLCLIFISCYLDRKGVNNQTSESYIDKLDSILQMKIMMAHEKQDEIEFRGFQNKFVPLMSKKHYSFNCVNGCDGMDRNNTDLEMKQGIETPYNVESCYIANDSTLLYSFSYITDCEMRFAGDIERRNDKLYLVLVDFNYPGTRCYCNYSFQFEIKKSAKRFKYVLVKRVKSKLEY